MVCLTHSTFVFLLSVTKKKKHRKSSNFQSVGVLMLESLLITEAPILTRLWQPDLEFLIFLSFFPTSMTMKEERQMDLSLRTWFFHLENWTVDGRASWFWLRAEAFARPSGQGSGSWF